MAEVGLPFRNSLWYYKQTDYTTDPVYTDTTYAISCEWKVGRPGYGSDKHVANYSADTPLSNTLWEQVDDFVFHLEYVPQCDDSMLTDVLNRDANGYLKSLGFMLGVNVDLAADADKTYYFLSGCKPKTVSISASTNNKYTVAIDFSVRSIVTDGVGSAGGFITDSLSDLVATEPSALTGAYLGFNVAGSIKDGSSNSLADIVDNFEVTFDHGLRDEWDHDSKEKVKCIEGKYACTGSFDMSMDEGGGMHFMQVYNQKQFDVYVDLGGTGCPRLQLKNCKWRTWEQTSNTDDGAIKESCPFTARLDNDGKSVVTDTPAP